MAKGPIIRKRGPNLPKEKAERTDTLPGHTPVSMYGISCCKDCYKIVQPLKWGRCAECDEKFRNRQRSLEPGGREERFAPQPAAEGPTGTSPAPVGPRRTMQNDIDESVENLIRWRRAPWLYVQEVLVATPDAWQDEVLHALVGQQVDGSPLPPEQPWDKIAMKACKGPGKSTLLAWIILWFLTCFANPKVVCTSITAENLRDGLWTEIAKWRNKSEFLKALLVWQTERIYMKEAVETWYASARTWPKEADKTKQADTLAGIHAQNTMLVLDEAGGIPVGVLAAGLAHHSTFDPSGQANEVHYTLMAGNPTSLDGALGWACTEDSKHWFVKEITGDPDDPNRAPRIDMGWAREMITKWGADNDWVLVNVFGKFPKTQANKLLGSDIVRKAMALTVPEVLWSKGPRIMALDVARSLSNDRSVLCRRQGNVVFPFRIWRLDDLMVLTGQVAFEYSRWPADVIFVDMVGLGSGVLDRLRELGLPATGVNSGLPANDTQRFLNKRTEMWWDGSMAIKGSNGVPALALPNLPELPGELTGPVVRFNSKGQMLLESKEDMKKRGLDSPDIADSIMLTYAEPVRASVSIGQSTQEALARVQQVQSDFDPYEVT